MIPESCKRLAGQIAGLAFHVTDALTATSPNYLTLTDLQIRIDSFLRRNDTRPINWKNGFSVSIAMVSGLLDS